PMRWDERAAYDRNRDRYFPAAPQAAALRLLARNVDADQPILKEYFQDLGLPPGMKMRLAPGMRAVGVSLPKDRCVGGLIQVGDWVDVHLRTSISQGSGATIRTANLAHNARVIAKRNNLW